MTIAVADKQTVAAPTIATTTTTGSSSLLNPPFSTMGAGVSIENVAGAPIDE